MKYVSLNKNNDRNFVRNTFGITMVEIFWGFGLPVVMESTFLQLFLENLGASKIVIGIVPGILSIGNAVFSILSAYLTSHLKHKRRAVIWAHTSASIPLILFGVLLLFIGKGDYTVAFFILFYLLFALGIGLTVPVWQNFTVKIFSEENSIKAISIMIIFQIAARLIGGLCIVQVVSRFAFSIPGSALTFITVGFLFTIGALFFLIVKENTGEEESHNKEAHNIQTIFRTAKDIFHNRNYIYYLLSGIETFVCFTIISFYANYAVEYYNLDKSIAAGLFVILIQAGGVCTSIIFGWFNVFSLKGKFILTKFFTMTAIMILFFAHSSFMFLAASFMIGLARGIQNVSITPIIKKLSGMTDATDYYAISPIIQLPFSFGIPFLAGLFLETFAGAGVVSYRILFFILFLLVIFSFYCILKVKMEKTPVEN